MSDSASDSGPKDILFRTDASMLKTEVTAAEWNYRETEFSSEREVLKKPRIECTVCTKNLKDLVVSGQSISAHPSLGVILCDKCMRFYGDGNFSVDEDGSDKYCRWCGNGGNLYCCSSCSVAICLKCVKQNLTKSYLNKIEDDDWKCFVCDTKPIWPHRAVCWAAKKHVQNVGKKKTKRTKIEMGSESEESVDLVTRRSKRTKKASSTDEDEPVKENKAENTKRGPVRSGDKKSTKREPVRASSRQRNTAGDQRKSKRADSSVNSSPAISPAQKQLKFMEHVVTDTLQDFDKLMKIMAHSKAKYVERYVKNRRFLRDVENVPILRQKLLELLQHCEQSMAFVRQNFVSNLKNFDLTANDESDDESHGGNDDDSMEVDPVPPHSVCSLDETEPINTSEVPEVAEESACSQASENGVVEAAAEDGDSCSEVEKAVTSNAENEMVAAQSDTEVDETEVNNTNDADTSKDGTSPAKSMGEMSPATSMGEMSPAKSTGEMSPAATSTQVEKDVPVSPTEAAAETSSNVAASSPDESACAEPPGTAVSDSEDTVKGTEDSLQNENASDAEMAVAGPSGVSAPASKDKLAKVAMLRHSSSDENSSPEKQSNADSSPKKSNKSSETDISGVGPLKPDAEETKLKKKKKRKERDEAKKSFLRDSSSSDDENKAVDRLTNLASLRRRRKAAGSEEEKTSSDEDLAAGSVTVAKPEKKNKKSSSPQTKNKSWAMDFVCSGSGSEDDGGPEGSFSKFNSSLDEKRKDFSINKDEISKKILLKSSDSEDKSGSEDDLLLNKDSSPKKKDKKKAEKSVDGERSSGDEAVAMDEDGEDSDDVNQKKKAKWKNNKLLKGKLSETDTSDEERQVARALKKKEKEKEKAEENGDHSSDSEDLFRSNSKVPPVRKKRKLKLLSSESEATADESQSSSVEEISDDSDEPKKKKTKTRKRVKNNMDSDESEDETEEKSQTPGSASKGRKNIRKVLKDEEVAEQTRKTAKEEEERKKRIADRQALFNKSFQVKDTSDQMLSKLVLDFDEETKEELVAVHPQLLKKLKPHQAEGVKFMWDSCYESLKQIEKGVGGGCILAHCMGLGKTLQVITLVYTLLTHEATKVKSVLVLCPLSTVLNWVSEFKTWLGDLPEYEDLTIYELTKYKNVALRVHTLRRWSEDGGIMVIGYDMFRSLIQGRNAREKNKKQICKALLDPGPDLVICDEGHMLKNEKTAISKATMQIKSLRRIILTGTPLQNNLIEYHCMMQFVKPNLLGEKKEFQNRFVNPITNGQYVDSTPRDVKLMKRRAHVLHKMLDGIVQRFDYKVLTPFLPPKHEFVISVALSDLQAKLYEYYIKNKSLTVAAGTTTLFKDYQMMRLIWTHPMTMKLNHDRKQKQLDKERYNDDDSEGSLKDFVVSGSDDESSKSDSSSGSTKSVISVSSGSGKKNQKNGKPKGRLTRAQRKEMGVDADEIENVLEYEPVSDWWHQFVDESDVEDYKQGPKLVLLFAILKQCELIGDKVLIFSQSIPSLDMIEYFLQKSEEFSQRVVGEDSLAPEDDLADYIGTWNKGEDYFRLDGQTPNDLRAHYCQIFNKPDNTRGRLFLISTKAGGLGINLTAANRVIIFDASWNPSYDIQSIFRVYRFGQNKPCYIYRFLSQGTMEEKIYERQVTKLSISCRVVDEQQIDRHFTRNEVAELYNFNRKMPSPDEIPKLPSDRLMAEMLKEYKDLILSYHEHDSLLENVADEDLTEEEKRAAWLDYEQEKNRPLYVPPPPRVMDNPMFEGFGRNIDNQAIMNALKAEHPTANTQQLLTMFNMVRTKLERYYQEQMLQSMGVPQPMNNQPNPGAATATSKELQDQLRMRKAAFMHQLQAQAAAGNQPDMNPGFNCWNEPPTPSKSDYSSTPNGHQRATSPFTTPQKAPPSPASPFVTPQKAPASPFVTPQKTSPSPLSMTPSPSPSKDAGATSGARDPLKIPSTWTFKWDEPQRKRASDLQTLLAEVSQWWSPKFDMIGDNVLMHLPFCVRRDTLERKLSRYLSSIRFGRVQPDIDVQDALDVIVKWLKPPAEF